MKLSACGNRCTTQAIEGLKALAEAQAIEGEKRKTQRTIYDKFVVQDLSYI